MQTLQSADPDQTHCFQRSHLQFLYQSFVITGSSGQWNCRDIDFSLCEARVYAYHCGDILMIKALSKAALKFQISADKCKTYTRLGNGIKFPAGRRGGLVLERRTPEREVGGSSPTRVNRVVSLSKAHLLPKSTDNIQEVVAPSQHD